MASGSLYKALAPYIVPSVIDVDRSRERLKRLILFIIVSVGVAGIVAKISPGNIIRHLGTP
jgi:hypothetical protein